MDLNLLLVFEALMDERNVTRAAGRVGLSQPAMSNALGRLRRTFDDPLLVRTPEGMAPTPLAQTLIVPVRQALAALRGALDEHADFNPAEAKRCSKIRESHAGRRFWFHISPASHFWWQPRI
ncbi:MAG: LysR family transcriptional regulator [Acidobacteria bacterium]|nr:LysR family transcriptional regulator [Acidobacteriota bacterium]